MKLTKKLLCLGFLLVLVLVPLLTAYGVLTNPTGWSAQENRALAGKPEVSAAALWTGDTAAHDLRCERDLASVQLCPRTENRKAPRIKAEAASVQLHDRFLPRPEPRERPLAVRFFPLKDALEYPLAYALRYRSVRALNIHAARHVGNQQHREIHAVAQAEFRPARQIWFALRRAEERFLIRDIFRK